jgi:hypothetical protein
MHRRTFEVTKVGDQFMSRLMKDTISMPRFSTAEIDFIADDPGPTFLHCRHQDQLDKRLRRADHRLMETRERASLLRSQSNGSFGADSRRSTIPSAPLSAPFLASRLGRCSGACRYFFI